VGYKGIIKKQDGRGLDSIGSGCEPVLKSCESSSAIQIVSDECELALKITDL
jgi:hypothetical protein